MKRFCSFSEAIREGAKLTAQAFGQGIGLDGASTCAWGAGVHAIAGSLERTVYDACDPLTLFPYLTQETACPADGCGYVNDSIYLMIYHLNDAHQWGRSAIADWLESEEEKLGFVHLIEPEPSRSQTEAVSEMVVV